MSLCEAGEIGRRGHSPLQGALHELDANGVLEPHVDPRIAAFLLDVSERRHASLDLHAQHRLYELADKCGLCDLLARSERAEQRLHFRGDAQRDDAIGGHDDDCLTRAAAGLSCNEPQFAQKLNNRTAAICASAMPNAARARLVFRVEPLPDREAKKGRRCRSTLSPRSVGQLMPLAPWRDPRALRSDARPPGWR